MPYGRTVKIGQKVDMTLDKHLQRNFELVFTLVSNIEASEQYRIKLMFLYAILVGQSFV